MAQIFTYEVELRITEKATDPRVDHGKVELVTRTEHAYSLMDAMHQAVFNHIAGGTQDIDMKVVRVGPPLELIQALKTPQSDALDGLLARFMKIAVDGKPESVKTLSKMALAHRAKTPKSDVV